MCAVSRGCGQRVGDRWGRWLGCRSRQEDVAVVVGRKPLIPGAPVTHLANNHTDISSKNIPWETSAMSSTASASLTMRAVNASATPQGTVYSLSLCDRPLVLPVISTARRDRKLASPCQRLSACAPRPFDPPQATDPFFVT